MSIIDREWGGLTEGGWKTIPIVFIESYAQLGISAEQFAFIVTVHSFFRGQQQIFPQVEVIAELMGKSVGTVRRYIRDLRNVGYLITTNKGPAQRYDFTPLYKKIMEVEKLNVKSREYHTDGKSLFIQNGDKKSTTRGKGATVHASCSDVNAKNESPPHPPYKEDNVDIYIKDMPTATTDVVATTEVVEENGKNGSSGKSSLGVIEGTGRKSSLGNLLSTALENIQVRHAERKTRTRARIDFKGSKSPPKSNKPKGLDRLVAKSPSQYTCNDIAVLMQESMKEKWGYFMGKVTMKERGQLKNMIKEYGAEEVAVTAWKMVNLWEEVKGDLKLSGYPSIAILYGYRRSLVPWAANGGMPESRPSWAISFDPKSERPDGQESGWPEEWSEEKPEEEIPESHKEF